MKHSRFKQNLTLLISSKRGFHCTNMVMTQSVLNFHQRLTICRPSDHERRIICIHYSRFSCQLCLVRYVVLNGHEQYTVRDKSLSSSESFNNCCLLIKMSDKRNKPQHFVSLMAEKNHFSESFNNLFAVNW